MEGFLGEYVPSAVRHCASSTATAAAFPTATRTGARPRPSQPDFLYVPKPGRQTRHYRTAHAHTTQDLSPATTTTTTTTTDSCAISQIKRRAGNTFACSKLIRYIVWRRVSKHGRTDEARKNVATATTATTGGAVYDIRACMYYVNKRMIL